MPRYIEPTIPDAVVDEETAKRLADRFSTSAKALASARAAGNAAAETAAQEFMQGAYAEQAKVEAKTPKPSGSVNVPSGFSAGQLPSDLKKFYGDEPDVVGYKITTNPDGSISVSVAKSNGQVLGYGARVRQNASGTYEVVSGGGGSAATPGTSSASTVASKDSKQENAIELLKRTFASYGIDSLADTITDLVRKGYSGDTVSLMLQDTPAYKQRFAANEARKKAGLPVLSPAEYLATESAYRNVMQAAGLPKGFYDSSSDFQKFLENDMSPSELNQRVQTAADAVANADPMYSQQLQKLYGLSTGDMIAHALDPERALPLLQRRASAVNYATAAAQQGLDVGVQPSEYYAGLGITGPQARAGFTQIAQTLPTYQKLQEIYGAAPGAGASLADLQAATFGGAGEAEAQKRVKQLAAQEQAQFRGQSGVGQTTFGTSEVAGQL